MEESLPEELKESLRIVNEVLGAPLVRVAVEGGSEDALSLGVVDDWGRLQRLLVFSDPAYVQLEWGFESEGHRLHAYRWPYWREHNASRLTAWAVLPGDIHDDFYVFAFEPTTPGGRVGVVVAEGLAVRVEPPRVVLAGRSPAEPS